MSEAARTGGPAALPDWLAHAARLAVGATLASPQRARSIWQRLGLRFDAPLVCVAGTNGKSSTCALLEAIAVQAGFRVGLCSSAALLRFEERCRVDGQPLAAPALLPSFAAVDQARQGEALALEEFITLALLHALALQPLDLVVVEVALGPVLAAAGAIDADCAVLTTLDIDPAQFLAADRDRIGFEAAQIMRPGRAVVVGDPMPPPALLAHAEQLGADLRRTGRDFNYAGDKQQWSWAGRSKRFNALAYPALRGVNQLLNAAAALAAFEVLRERLPVSAQAVRNGLAMVELPGRFQIVPGQPTLVLDIAHNDHAAASLVQNLDQMAFHPRTQALFGSLRDHDLAGMLRRLAPVVDTWRFIDLAHPNAVGAAELLDLHRRLDLRGPGPVRVERHADALEALQAAIASADPADRIVGFGSLAVVGAVLAGGVPRMPARHAG